MINKKEITTLKEYGRGVIGGLLFSLPLLFTMELWLVGFIASDEKLLAFVLFTFILLLGYNKFAGMRPDSSNIEILKESAEEIGIAFIVTFLFLLLINKINFTMSLNEVLGKVIVECMVVAIGISVGTAQLGEEDKRDNEQSNHEENKQKKEKKQLNGNPSLVQLWILSLCGATLFVAPVAPTEEIFQIAIESTYTHLLLMIFLSILLSFVIFYYSDFLNTKHLKNNLKEILIHLTIAYCAALIIAYILLYFFETGNCGNCSFNVHIAKIVVLSIPGLIGASAGRLLIK